MTDKEHNLIQLATEACDEDIGVVLLTQVDGERGCTIRGVTGGSPEFILSAPIGLYDEIASEFGVTYDDLFEFMKHHLD